MHIAHDCRIGDSNVFANNTSLAGHVKVKNFVNFGGFVKISQYCQIGDHAFLCADSVITKDVPACIKVAPNPARPAGLNTVGLDRCGVDAAARALLKKAYSILYQQKHTLSEAITKMRKLENPGIKQLEALIQSVERSERGIALASGCMPVEKKPAE